MYCSACGTPNRDDALSCTACRHVFSPRVSSSAAVENLRKSSEDAWKTLLVLAGNPVGDLHTAFDALGDARALGVGIAFGIVFAGCAAIAFTRTASEWLFRGFLYGGYVTTGDFLKAVVVFVVPFLALAVAIWICRAVARAQGSAGHDVFLAGAALLPLAAFSLLFTLLGIGNIEIDIVLLVIAQCVTVLMLFSGLTRIYAVSEKLASLAVPLMLVVSAWISKVIYAAFMTGF
jgi:hypothetical protein